MFKFIAGLATGVLLGNALDMYLLATDNDYVITMNRCIEGIRVMSGRIQSPSEFSKRLEDICQTALNKVEKKES